MKTLNETFSDDEYEMLKELKNDLSWRNFILLLAAHAQDSIRLGNLTIGERREVR